MLANDDGSADSQHAHGQHPRPRQVVVVGHVYAQYRRDVGLQSAAMAERRAAAAAAAAASQIRVEKEV